MCMVEYWVMVFVECQYRRESSAETGVLLASCLSLALLFLDVPLGLLLA